MKRLQMFVAIFIAIVQYGTSQEITIHSHNDINPNTSQIMRHNAVSNVCGNILFHEDIEENQKYIAEHPDYQRLSRTLQKPQSYIEGEKKEWWVVTDIGLETDVSVQLASTCMAVGEYCYIFVSDDSWASGKITQDQIDVMVDAFDNTTPAFPNKGIYEVDVETFGEPPDTDGDPKIVIFFYDIQDDFATTGQATQGYFAPWDLSYDGDPAWGTRRSNEAEIFYIDTYPTLDENIFGINDAKEVIVHEFQHMIHYGHDSREMTFVDEGLSEIASYICGYPLRSNVSYTHNTNRNLLFWDYDDVIPDYSRAALWTLYLFEQYPNSNILKDFVNNSHSEWAAIDGTLRGIDISRGFFNIFEEWLIANYVNGNSNDTKYMYQYSPLSKIVPSANHIGNSGQGSGTVVPFGSEYITFSGGDDLDITFTFEAPLIVKALNIGSLDIVNINSGVEYSPASYGTTYPEITFLVYNQSAGASKTYSYEASGAAPTGSVELAYETGTSDGTALTLNEEDTVAVYFDGLPGFGLDSVKIAFRQNGRIKILINEYTNIPQNSSDTPFGIPLMPDTLININVGGSPGWHTIDLTTLGIGATNDFIVGAVIGTDPVVPGIGATSEIPVGTDHTLFYSFGNWGNEWVYPVGDADNTGFIWKYMIRAYVSDGSGATSLAQPAIVSIVANQGNVQLNWNSSAGPVEGYNIYRSSTTGFTPDSNTKIGSVSKTTTSYTDALPNIQANTDYFYRISSFDGGGTESDYSDEATITTLTIKDNNGKPTEYALNSNYPNPFNPSTTFRFATPKDGLVKFTVHDLLGRVIYSESRDLFAGNYSFTWSGQNQLDQRVVSGVYFLRMETEGFVQTRKMLMMK